MTNKSYVAVAGCGHWGKNLVRNFYQLGALHAICDNNPDTVKSMQKQYGVLALEWGEILSNNDIKAVVIASPAPFHFNMAQAALNAGKDVYVEKPITLKNEEAQALCDLAKEKNQILMVGHLLQYHPAFIKAKNIVEEGQLGKINYIYSNRMSFGKIRREENVLWSFAPHDVSMILAIAGGDSPTYIDATGSAQTHDIIEDCVLVNMKFDNGISAHINVSWINPFKEQKLVVIGDNGMLVFDDQKDWPEKLMLYPHQIKYETDVPELMKVEGQGVDLQEGEPLKMECQHFLDSVENRSTPRSDGEEGLRVLDVLNRAEQSMKAKQ